MRLPPYFCSNIAGYYNVFSIVKQIILTDYSIQFSLLTYSNSIPHFNQNFVIIGLFNTK